MRPLTTTQQRLLSSPVAPTVRARVRVLGPDGTWYNLSAFLNQDFLEEVEVDESLDSPVAEASVRVRREVNGLSLAPLMVDSRANNLGGAYSPLLQAGRRFRVEVGLAPSGCEPGPADWLPLFYGRIDDVDAGGDVLSFKGRDYAGLLQDTYVRTEAQYGSTAGTPLQTVCQSLLNDNHLSEFGLFVPQDLQWALGPYQQSVEPVADALAKLATARGAEWRWKWRVDTGDWGLWLYVPDRTGTTPVATYAASDYQALGSLTSSLADVRTLVEVVYSDSTDLDAAGQPKRKTVVREDTAATQRYGYLAADGTWQGRYMRLAEAATSNIRTAAQATKLADSALADLSTSALGSSVEVRLHPALELADLVRLTANGVHFSADQVLAVRQVTHSFTAQGATTRLSLLGKPALSPRVWLGLEARPGVAPAPTFTGPAAPSALAVTNTPSGAALLFTAPDATQGVEADSYELHVGTTSGFTLSAATLKGVSSSTRFDVTGLTAGSALYARVRSRDAKGNVGPASAEVALAPKYTSPGLLQPNISYGQLPLNGDAEAQSDAASPPDGWSMLAGAWGVDAVSDTTNPYSGARAVKLNARAAGLTNTRLGLQAFVARTGERFAVQALVQATAGGMGASLYVSWLSSSFTVLSTKTVASGSGLSAGVWTALSGYVTVPAGARYARVEVAISDSTFSGSLYVDSVVCDPSLTVVPAWTRLSHPSLGGGSLTDYQNGWGPLPSRAFRYRLNPLGNVELSGTLVSPLMPASISTVYVFPAGYGYWPDQPVVFRIPVSGGYVSVGVDIDGTLRVYGAPGNTEIPLDGCWWAGVK